MKNSSKTQGVKRTKRGPEAAAIPISTEPTNANGDRLAMIALIGLLVLAVGFVVFGLWFGITQFFAGYSHVPLDWGKCVVSVVGLAFSLLAARGVASLSFFAAVAIASRMGAWKTVEAIGQHAPKLNRLLPGGTSWLTTAYVQSLVNRGQYEPAIERAQSEWDRSANDEKQLQYLGTICFTAGIANQATGDAKQAHIWNERSIDILNKTLEQLSKPKKGVLDKAMAPQADQAISQLQMQLAAAYFNTATHHFNAQDFRRARENYKFALDASRKAPDFPQKDEMMKFATEQISRLKHS